MILNENIFQYRDFILFLVIHVNKSLKKWLKYKKKHIIFLIAALKYATVKQKTIKMAERQQKSGQQEVKQKQA